MEFLPLPSTPTVHGSSWDDGVVTSVDPFRVKLDRDTVERAFESDSLVDPAVLTVEDRVRCELASGRVIVHGRAGGSRPMRLSFPTKSALDAFTGWPGLVGFVVSESSEYVWVDGDWKLWWSRRAVWTPTWTNFTPGNGEIWPVFSVHAGLVQVELSITFGSTSAVLGDLVFSLPIPRKTTLVVSAGVGRLVDSSTGARRAAAIILQQTTARVRYLNDANSDTAFSASSPWTWAESDQITAMFTYAAF